VSDFFEPPPTPPDRPQPTRYRTPPWFGAPAGTLPGVVALELVLARTDTVAVCVSRIAAYPTGFSFEIVTLTDQRREDLDPLLFEHPRLQRMRSPGEIPPELMRFGVRFADGTKVTNTGGMPLRAGKPDGPVMIGGGGGGGGRWNQQQWVWPLPPAGPLLVVCEWPAADIPLTQTELDAQLILDAARRAQVIFNDDHLPEPPEEEGDGIVVIR
jgi:hypothetical protein